MTGAALRLALGDLATLAYFERQRLVHRIAQILRSPSRAVMWIAYGAAIVLFLGARVVVGSASARPPAALDPRIAACIGSSFLLFLGAMILGSQHKGVGAFESLAEARFMALSHLSRPLLVGWMQVRASLGLLLRIGISLVFSLSIFIGNRANGTTTLYAVAATLLATYLTCALPIPIALARGPLRTVYAVLGWTAIALGATFLAAEATLFLAPGSAEAALAAHVPASAMGAFVQALLRGDARAFGALVLLAILATGLTLGSARDAFPELYEMSRLALERTRAVRGEPSAILALFRERTTAGATNGRTRTVTRGTARVPSGAWVLVWRDWLGLRRGRGISWLALGLAAWYAAGFALGFVAAHGDRHLRLIPISLLGIGLPFGVIAASFLGQRLGLDMQKPIFALAGTSTLARLTALFASSLWRGTLTFGGAGVVGCIAASRIDFALAVPFVAAAVVALVVSTGIALFSLFPSQLDQRGPVALLRSFAAMFALTTPAAMLLGAYLIAPLLGTHLTALAGTGVFALGAAVEAALLLTFAAWRIDAKPEAFGRPTL